MAAKTKESISNSKKNSFGFFTHKYFLITYALLVLFLAIAFISSTPKILDLAESKIIISANQVAGNPKTQIGEETSEEQQPQIKIVSLGIKPPNLTSGAALVLDFDTNQILFDKNIFKRMSPASTTKILTALVAAEHYKSADILTVRAEDLVGGSTMGLSVGERLSFRSLLYGMMLNSGNDAAFTIASNYPGGLEAFVEQMNKKVSSLDLQNSHFQNPAGFDGVTHYTTAYDLAQIAKEAENNSQLAKVVSTKETEVISWDKTRSHNLKNLNKLLGEEGVLGIKTGFSEQSGENLVGLVERDGHKVLTVVLNSQDRFGESKALIDWVYKNYSWRQH